MGNPRAEVEVSKRYDDTKGKITYMLCATSDAGKLGVTAIRKQQRKKALGHFKQAVEDSRSGNDEGKASARTLFNYGIVLELDSEFEEAVKVFNELSDQEPTDTYIDCFNRVTQKVKDS